MVFCKWPGLIGNGELFGEALINPGTFRDEVLELHSWSGHAWKQEPRNAPYETSRNALGMMLPSAFLRSCHHQWMKVLNLAWLAFPRLFATSPQQFPGWVALKSIAEARNFWPYPRRISRFLHSVLVGNLSFQPYFRIGGPNYTKNTQKASVPLLCDPFHCWRIDFPSTKH